MMLGPVRPRFRLEPAGDMAAAMARVVEVARRPEHRCVCRVLGHHIDIAVIPEDRRRWSPCVQMEFHTDDAGRVVVNGLVGPHPNLWTFFAFLNISVALLAGIALMLGLVQVSLEMHPWGFWACVACLLCLAGLYVVSQVGQRCAAEQTALLRRLVHEALTGR